MCGMILDICVQRYKHISIFCDKFTRMNKNLKSVKRIFGRPAGFCFKSGFWTSGLGPARAMKFGPRVGLGLPKKPSGRVGPRAFFRPDQPLLLMVPNA